MNFATLRTGGFAEELHESAIEDNTFTENYRSNED